MNLKIKDLKGLLLLSNFQSLGNLKRLCVLVGFTNIITCIIFYYWLFNFKAHQSYSYPSLNISRNLLITAAIMHTYINMVLIIWTLPHEGAKWNIWAWLSLIFVSPLGLVLIFVSNNEKTWENSGKTKKNISIFHSLPNSFVNLPSILNKSLDYLNKTYPEDFSKFLNIEGLKVDNLNEWTNKEKYLIIAMYEALKQTKKKNSFKDIDFNAHWYDQRFFDFALKDPKDGIVPNLRYKYSLAFIVLDEFNNYQKILNGKKEIKTNMRFGPAKTVCLHWGKGFKVFVNE